MTSHRMRMGGTRLLLYNNIAARLAFGDEWMDRFTRRRGGDEASSGSGP
jgi:hypothetical protein